MKSEHPFAQMLAIALAAAAILIGLSFVIDWFPTGSSTNAHEVDTLYHVLLIVSILIFVLVMTVAIYSVWRFRARPGDLSDGAPIHGNTRLEIIWVAIPFVLVTALAGYGWKVLADEETVHKHELHVRAIGQQFAWHFQYENRGNFQTDQLYLPKSQPVRFDIVSKDVIHEFWVPSTRLGEDAVPGIVTQIRFTPNRLGTYDIVCAELCGAGHATMRAQMHVLTPEAWDTWRSHQKPGTTVPGTGVPSPPVKRGNSASLDRGPWNVAGMRTAG
jgi:cytochrome c oxidase subunit II